MKMHPAIQYLTVVLMLTLTFYLTQLPGVHISLKAVYWIVTALAILSIFGSNTPKAA